MIAGAWLAGAPLAQEPVSGIVGRWQYLQPPDSEGEVLDISRDGGRYRGVMSGLERAGEHGLYYYVVEVTDLRISTDGRVSFAVGSRSFFRQRPGLSALGKEGNAGRTLESMSFSGRLDGADLVLRCEGPGASCPDAVLRFRKLERPR
jgi:hypothetical protein